MADYEEARRLYFLSEAKGAWHKDCQSAWCYHKYLRFVEGHERKYYSPNSTVADKGVFLAAGKDMRHVSTINY